MVRANLADANLRGVLFDNVNLEGALLTNANLSGANLERTTGMTHEQINSAKTDLRTVLPVIQGESALKKQLGKVKDFMSDLFGRLKE